MDQRYQNISKNTKHPRVLVIDDEPEMCRCLEKCLSLLECSTSSCTSGPDGLALLESTPFDIVFTDLRMPDMSGIEVVRAVRRISSETDSIVLTGYGTIGSAVEAIRAGASDYLTKPFKLHELRAAIEKIKRNRASRGEVAPVTELIGQSAAILEMRRKITQVAAVQSTALIYGETGAGKEIVAKTIHAQSNRRMRAFIPVNCGAIQETLLESELFGHERGAFTGANETRPGKVEAANNGTLLLDEIAETSLGFQTALLRVLQEREIVRVGSNKPIPVDFRLIAATNKDLAAHVKAGTFREDLYYRLNVINIKVPSLREHREDIPELCEYFIARYRARLNSQVCGISEAALAAMGAYHWPGNIRQLENTIEKAMVLATSDIIDVGDLPSEVVSDTMIDDIDTPSDDYFSGSLKEARDTFERAYIERALKDARGNVSEAARQAGLARPYFHERIRKHDIDPQQYRI